MTRRSRAPAGEERGVVAQTSTILAARVIGAASTAALTVVLARLLEPDGFGRYVLALTIAGGVGLAAELGIGPATARFVAERVARDEPVGDVVRRGLAVKAAVAVASLLILVAAAGLVARAFGDPELAPLIRIAAVGVLLADAFAWLVAMLESLRRAKPQAGMVLTKSAVELVTALVLVSAGAGATGALSGNVAGFAAAVAVGFAVLRPAIHGNAGEAGVGTRTLVAYGAHIWVAGVAWLAFERVDQLLLGVFMDASAVAIYEAPWRLMTTLTLATVALAAVIGPRLVGRPARDAARLVTNGLRFALLLTCTMAAIIAVLADDAVTVVLGAEYLQSVDVVRLLLPFLVLASLAPLATRALDYLGEARSRRWIAIGALGANVALDLVLIPTVGLPGPAIATNVAIALFVGGHLVLLSRRLPLDWERLRKAGVWAVLAAGAASATAAGATLLPGPAAVRLVVGTLGGLTAAAGCLMATGQLPLPPPSAQARARVAVPYIAGAVVAGLGGVAAAIDPVAVIVVCVAALIAALLLRDVVTGLATFALIAPISQLPQLGVVSGQFAKLGGMLLAVTWLIAVASRRLRAPGSRALAAGVAALGAFLVLGLLSSGWANANDATYDAVVRWALGGVLMVIVATSLDRPAALRAVAGAFSIGAAIAVVVGFTTGGPATDERLEGAIGDPNVQAAALVPAVLIAGVLALAHVGRRLPWGFVAGVCLVGLFATGSRGGLIAVTVAVVGLVVVAGSWRRILATATAVAVVAGTGYIMLAAPAAVRERVVALVTTGSADGGTGRTDIWQVGARAFADSPVTGVGLGNYSEAVPRHLDAPGLIRRPDFVLGDVKVAHNTYLHVLTELGVLGLALFTTLIAAGLAAAAGAIRATRGRSSPDIALLVRAVLCGTVGILVADIFLSGQYETELWVMLGLCFAAATATGAARVSPVLSIPGPLPALSVAHEGAAR